MAHQLTRRGFLGRAGAAAAIAGTGAARLGMSGSTPAAANVGSPVVPFHGEHQAGIATPQQRHVALAAFDVHLAGLADLRSLLRDWTQAAEAMTAGLRVSSSREDPREAGADTGEALGLPPSRLTVTVAVGPSLFDDRFGLAARRPPALADLPAFRGDKLDPRRCAGDLVVQACADDPMVAFHAARQLRRTAGKRVDLRWWQSGFLPERVAGSAPRNLLGFQDGTRNLDTADQVSMARHVWVGDEATGATSWLRGGTYLVVRRILLRLDDWDADTLDKQEATFGRKKDTGARLRALPATAHIRLASPEANRGVRLLRRGYSFSDGADSTGSPDAGLLFLAFQRDPRRQFVVVQQRLAAHDALNEYALHTGSGVYAVLPGVARGESWGVALTD